MKRSTIVVLLLLIAFISCKDAEKPSGEAAALKSLSINTGEASTGTFSFDGKSVTGTVSTQHFGDPEKGNFSVLCQHNGGDAANPDFALLQITFVNEKEATGNASLKVYDGRMLPMTDPQPGLVTIALSGRGNGLSNNAFAGSYKTTGSIHVSGRTVTLKNITLYNRDGAVKTVSTTLDF